MPFRCKIVLPKVLQKFMKTPNCRCWPKELNQKGFRATYNTARDQKVPLFSFFFCMARLFFGKIFFSRGPPFNFFWSFATKWMLNSPEGSPFSVFFGIVRLSFKKGSPIHQYFDILKSCCYFLALDMAPTIWGRSRLVFLQFDPEKSGISKKHALF